MASTIVESVFSESMPQGAVFHLMLMVQEDVVYLDLLTMDFLVEPLLTCYSTAMRLFEED